MRGGLRGAIIVALAILAVQAGADPATARVLAVPDPDAGRPRVVIVGNDGSNQIFHPYGRNVRGGANVAAGDIDGDGRAEIVAGPGVGVRAPVQVFNRDPATGEFSQLSSFSPYGQGFLGGVFVGVADLTGDGLAEIITGPGAGRRPVIVNGGDGQDLLSFFAYDPSFRQGVRVAAGDVNNDGLAEIVTAPAGFVLPSPEKSFSGGSPEVRVFSPVGSLLSSFPAVDRPFRGGLSVAAGDFNNDGRDDIAAGMGIGGPPAVRVFPFLDDTDIVHTLMAYRKRFRGGVRVAAGDVNGDAVADLVTAPGPGIKPVVRVFALGAGQPIDFLAGDNSYLGGVSVAVGDVNGDGLAEILTSTEHLRLGTGLGSLGGIG
jgi:hypothetical protein